VPKFSRKEVQSAFELWWQVGNVAEDWTRWANMFIPDVTYQDYFWGPLRGRAELDLWINAVMKGVPEIYTVYEWHIIEDEKVVFECQNRRDNPDNEGPAYFDFPGMTVLRYAGDGLWESEFDYWDRTGARRRTKEFLAACERAGITDPMETMTRRHWPAGPDWARTEDAPKPSWLDRPELPGIQRPSQLRELLGRP
jgi:SnoaL-like domain